MDTTYAIGRAAPTAAAAVVQPVWARWARAPRVAIAISLTSGIALVVLTAPFQAPGEYQHFYRAYQISEGHWAADYRRDFGGGELPRSLTLVVEPFRNIRFNYQAKTSAQQISDALAIPLHPQQRRFVPFITALYSPVGYLPTATAIAVGRTMGMNSLKLMYLGRLVNLLCWMGIIYAALRIAPACRGAMLLLMFMPMSLFTAASLSIDAITNALALLVAAIILRYAVDPEDAAADRPMAWGIIIVLALTTAAMSVAKLAYLPLVGLLFLVPPRRLGGIRKYFATVLAIVVLNCAAIAAWEPYTHGLDVRVHDYPNVSPRGQIAYLVAHPAALVTVPLATTLRDTWPILKSFVGRLGWWDTPLSPVFLMFYLVAIVVTCLPVDGDPSPPRRSRSTAIVLSCVAASVAAVGLLNYIYWTPVGEKFVTGLQGRYFIPVAPAIIVLIWSLFGRGLPRRLWLRNPLRRDVDTAAIIVATCIYTLIAVYLRYYGPVVH